MPKPASIAIARALGASSIQADRSALHAAHAQAEIEAHARTIERLLATLRLTPEQVQAALATQAVHGRQEICA